MSGGGVPAGDIVPGPVPEHVRRGQEPGAAAGHGVPAAGVQAARAQLPLPARRAAHLLHRQQHHTRRPLRKFLSANFTNVQMTVPDRAQAFSNEEIQCRLLNK